MTKDYLFEIAFCESIHQRQKTDVTLMEMLAGFYTKAGRYDEGLVLDKKIVKRDPSNPVGYYNLACSLSLVGRHKDAVKNLRTALIKGYSDYRWLLQDPDLKDLHKMEIFEDLLADFQIKL